MHMGRNSACAQRGPREAGLSVRGGSGFLLPQNCNGSAGELVG